MWKHMLKPYTETGLVEKGFRYAHHVHSLLARTEKNVRDVNDMERWPFLRFDVSAGSHVGNQLAILWPADQACPSQVPAVPLQGDACI